MKKHLKKTFAIVISLAMLLSCLTVGATKFPDVTSENYSWAIDAIESMADEGIIKGYEDGTFNPAKTVSKFEALVLISRILGVNEEINQRLLENAIDTYAEVLDTYDLPYGVNEISYLLAKSVIDVDELEDYVDIAHRDDGLKRYEVAVLLTKALDAEASLKAELASQLTYDDTSDIPSNAKKYVAFVSNMGLMNGVGENKFAPSETVTRAQAAVVLKKLKDGTDYEYKKGIVTSIDPTSRLIKIKDDEGKEFSHYVTTDILLRYNGATIGINDIGVGYDATVTYKLGKFYAIDFTDSLIDDILYASFVGSASTSNKVTITVNVIDDNDTQVDTNEKSKFKLADECIITLNSNACTLSSIKSGSYVRLTLKKGIVTVLEAMDKTSKVSGRIAEIEMEPAFKFKIEKDGGEISSHSISTDVKVTRNGKDVTVRDILAGDSVNVTLNYGIITQISATSRSSAKNGVIKEVIISKSPKITITIDGVDTTYFMSSDAKITLSEKEATFYDLRVGMAASVKLEGDTVVSLESIIKEDVIGWSGTVLAVHNSYSVIQLEITDNITNQIRTESIYVKSTTTIQDYETKKTIKLTSSNLDKVITPGMKINVTGSYSTGLFEALNVIIIGK